MEIPSNIWGHDVQFVCKVGLTKVFGQQNNFLDEY